MADFKRIKETLDAIKAAPEHKFWMNDFVCVRMKMNNGWAEDTYSIHGPDHWELANAQPHECKTAYCIAGWGAFLWKGKDMDVANAFTDGMAYFDLTQEEAEYMFYGAWSENGSRAERAEAIKYLEAVVEAQSITPVDYDPLPADLCEDEYWDQD